MLSSRSQEHPRSGLAALAVYAVRLYDAFGQMGTVVYCVYACAFPGEHFYKPAVDFRQSILCEISPRYPRLVCDYYREVSAFIKLFSPAGGGGGAIFILAGVLTSPPH